MRAVFIGTLAPAVLMAGGMNWSRPVLALSSTYVQALRGPTRTSGPSGSEIKRVNPLTTISPELRRRLKLEREEARGDSRLKARFLSPIRMNVPSGDECHHAADSGLLATGDGAGTYHHETGKPIVGVDLGAGRAWSAAVAVWKNGRTEALALCPWDTRSIEAQETEGPG